MLRKLGLTIVVLAVIGGAAFWFMTTPRTLAASALPAHQPDLANGEYMFWAGGCTSCHAAPGAAGDDKLKLAGGVSLSTPFGKFVAPNISPDPEFGIGGWSTLDFVNAMKFGVAPDGMHLYPAFPYTSYQRMKLEDLIDLKAYLDTLPKVAVAAPPHELSFPFNIRRGLGLWQWLYVDGKTFEPNPAVSDAINRGAYLVEGPGHCAQCHTPRNEIGGTIISRAYAGGPAPEGTGRVPNITTDSETGLGGWSENDFVAFFETGFTPEFDSPGGAMAAVQQNIAKLRHDDIVAIAQYLKSLPPIASERRPAS